MTTVSVCSDTASVTERLIEHYTAGDEAGRLGRDRDWVEWRRTLDILGAHLPAAPARVADVGGGPGRYATHLATRGYTVHLFDLVPMHVELAVAAGLDATVADARRIPLEDEAVDAVLLLGPLYHLAYADERHEALAAAYRVLRPDGRVFAAALSRVGRVLVNAVAGLDGPDVGDEVRRVLDTGVTGAGDLFYRHTPDELRDELEAAGFRGVTVIGVQGPLGAWARARPELNGLAYAAARRTTDPATSIHMIGVGIR
jgi:SAM-dependent methyltransferase